MYTYCKREYYCNVNKLKNKRLLLFPLLILFACKQRNIVQHHTSKGWKLTTSDSNYYVFSKNREEYLWLNADSTFEGEAWIFMHGYNAEKNVSAIGIADTVAGKWSFDPSSKRLTLTDRDVFVITFNIIRWNTDTITFKVEKEKNTRVEDTGTFTLRKNY